MKKLTYPVLLILPFLLTACGPPTVFGIPQEQWNQLNQQQRSQVIDGYNQRTKAEAQVAPIYAIADALKAKKKTAKAEQPFGSNLNDDFFKTDHHPMMDHHIPNIGDPLPLPNLDNLNGF